MGSYLIVDGKENNSTNISYPMIDLLRELLPEKKSLHGEKVFAMTRDEVAVTLYAATELLSDKLELEQYIAGHSESYGMHDDFEKIKTRFEWIQQCFAKTLSEMILYDKDNIVCMWE